LNDFEKHILAGLYGSPTPLQLTQALKKSLGRELNLVEVFEARPNESCEKGLIDKKLILQKDVGYILSLGAEYAISKGRLKVKN
jgi:hypothetical protein